MAADTYCQINIGGEDVTADILPYLQELTTTDEAGGTADSCEVTLNDAGGIISLPTRGDPVTVLLGDVHGISLVFTGTVDDVKSSGSKGDGMKLVVSAKSADTNSKVKEPKQKHWDDKSLKDVAGEAAQLAGLEGCDVADSLASITRPYWAMQLESFLHFGERMAREVGGTFKVVGKKAIIADRNGGTSVSGKALPTFSAVRPGNLMSWEVSPTIGRPRFKQAKVRHYDVKAAQWKTESVDISIDDAVSGFTDRQVAADQGEAQQRGKSHKKNAEREQGGGSITVNGTTVPQPEGLVVLSGARPGVDGTYRINSVVQTFTKDAGWTTRLDLKQPQGDAGKDKRKSKRKHK